MDETVKLGLLINFGIAGFIGLTLNALLFYILCKDLIKRGSKSHVDKKICTFIAITDICLSSGLIFRSIFAQVPYNILKVHPNWCKLDVGVITQLMNCSGYTLGVMSIERFLLICFNTKLNQYIWFFAIFALWVTQYTVCFVCVLNGFQVLTVTEISCTFMVNETCISTFYSTAIFFIISFCSVIFSYTGIMIFKAKQCLNQINLNIPKDVVYMEFRSTLIKSLIYILVYIICFSGKCYTILFQLLTGRKRTILMDSVSQGLLAWSPMVNAIILLYMNEEVRLKFIKLLTSIKGKIFNSQ
jgi:hypothetical protein